MGLKPRQGRENKEEERNPRATWREKIPVWFPGVWPEQLQSDPFRMRQAVLFNFESAFTSPMGLLNILIPTGPLNSTWGAWTQASVVLNAPPSPLCSQVWEPLWDKSIVRGRCIFSIPVACDRVSWARCKQLTGLHTYFILFDSKWCDFPGCQLH